MLKIEELELLRTYLKRFQMEVDMEQERYCVNTLLARIEDRINRQAKAKRRMQSLKQLESQGFPKEW